MKLSYRFLVPTLIVLALCLAIFSSMLVQTSFSAQLSGEREQLRRRIGHVIYATQSAYANYALQGISVSSETL